MKILRKSILFMLVLMLFIPTFVFADSSNIADKGATSGSITRIAENGVSVDKTVTSILLDQDGNIINRAQNDSILRSAVLIDTKKVNMLWIGNLNYPNFWSQASGYTLTQGTNYTASGQYTWNSLVLTLNFSYSQSASVQFTADPTRWSRLGAYADVTFNKYQTTTAPITQYTEVVYRNKYVKVVYQ
jgi:hypothetical protein